MSYVVVSKRTLPVPSEEILRRALKTYGVRVIVSSCSGDDAAKILHFTGKVAMYQCEHNLWMLVREARLGCTWGFEWHLDDK